MQLEFIIDNQILKRKDTQKIVENSIGYLTAHFDMPSEYKGIVSAYFKVTHNGTITDAPPVSLDSNNICIVPSSVIKSGILRASITCTDTNLFVPTNSEIINVLPSGAPSSFVTDANGTNQYAGFQAMYQEVSDWHGNVVVNAAQAAESEAYSYNSELNAKTSETNSKASETVVKEIADSLTGTVTDAVKAADDAKTAAASAQETAENLETAYAPRLTTAESKLASNVTQVDVLSKGIIDRWWMPKTQPAIDGVDLPNASVLTSPQVYTLYENLRTKYSSYISSALLGLDASGLYNIYMYDFAPPRYEKTIILGAGIHGTEPHGIMGLYVMLQNICDNWQNSGILSYMRWNVRFIVMPLENPWGLNQQFRRYNYNHVDLNRNFDYNWSSYVEGSDSDVATFGGKGTSAFSEVESQYIRNVLLAHPEAVAYIDYHSGGWDSSYDYVASVPAEMSAPILNIISNIASYLKLAHPNNIQNNSTYTQPTNFNYASNVLFMPSCNPEYNITATRYPLSKSSTCVTDMVEWFANVAYQSIITQEKGAKVYEQYYSFTPGNPVSITNIGDVTTGTFVEQTTLSIDVPAEFDGIAIADISIVSKNDTSTAMTSFVPRLIQPNSYSTQQANTQFNELATRYAIYYDGDKRTPLHLQSQIKIKKGSDKVHLGLLACVTAGTTLLQRYRARLLLIPSRAYGNLQILDYLDVPNVTKIIK